MAYNVYMEDPVIVPEQKDITVSTEEAVFPWLQMVDEPWNWFQRFIKYYLPLGPGRSLYGAYTQMVETEHPEVAAARRAKAESDPTFRKKKAVAINSWTKCARLWDWRERAKAFDRFTYKAAQAQVDNARITLLGSANKAALALVEALTNPRLQVAAAKEILDRAGLPGTTNVGLGPIEKFSADELSQAEQEVDAWESQVRLNPKSDLNG